MAKYTWFLNIFSLLIIGTSAVAERMDSSTHDLMISKLESVLTSMPKHGTEFKNITLRIADLYADRARLKLLEQKDGSADRKSALRNYKLVVSQLNAIDQGAVVLQMAHLQNLLDQTNDAEKTLAKAIKNKSYTREVLSKAHAQIGEIYFKKANFVKAEQNFKKSITLNAGPQTGFISYRLAWAQFNQGHFEQALASLKKLLSDPNLISDASFHEDLTRDLVTFISRTPVSEKEIEFVAASSPENLRKENLRSLANELERLGKKSSATLAWKSYNLEGDSAPKDEIETQIRVAQLQWDLGAKDKALIEFRKATALWKDHGCKTENCDELKKRFKNFVTTWNRVEKDLPSAGCLASYSAYLETFSDDSEMTFKAATVAEQIKNYPEAKRLFAKSADLAAKDAKSEIIEAALEREISNAELTRDSAQQINAYDHYLILLPNGPKNIEARYQKAHALQSLNKRADAVQLFDELARLSPIRDRGTQLKAADLALDNLGQLKLDEEVFAKSDEYRKIFPERSREYSRIHQQAALNLAAVALNKKNSSDSEQKHELDRLSQISTAQMTDADRISNLKAQIALAERIHDLDMIAAACSKLLKISNLKSSDREFAESRLIWVSELKMDFSQALHLTQQSATPRLNRLQRQLRLAMLAELAGSNAAPFYKKALQETNERDKQLAIRTTLIRMSSSPWQTLREQGAKMRNEKTLLRNLILELYAKNGQRAQASAAMTYLKTQNNDLNKLFFEQDLLKNWARADFDIQRLTMNSRSDALLQNSIRQRQNAIRQVEKIGKIAIQNQSWLGQLAVLMTLSREQRRLYSEIVDLPAPKRLNSQDKKKYLALVEKMAKPYKVSADLSAKRADQFLDQSKNIDRLDSLVKTTKGYVQKLVIENIRTIRVSRLDSIAKEYSEAPTSQELLALQSEVKKDPFDIRQLEKLKEASEKRGSYTLAAYLEGRLIQLKKGVIQ